MDISAINQSSRQRNSFAAPPAHPPHCPMPQSQLPGHTSFHTYLNVSPFICGKLLSTKGTCVCVCVYVWSQSSLSYMSSVYLCSGFLCCCCCFFVCFFRKPVYKFNKQTTIFPSSSQDFAFASELAQDTSRCLWTQQACFDS